MKLSLALLSPVMLFMFTALTAQADASGSATVQVVTEPALGSGTFRFSGTPSGELNLTGVAGSLSASGLAAGSYNATLTRTDPAAVQAGYELVSVTCNDSDSKGGVLSRRATFEIADGESVTCTFLLTKVPEQTPQSDGPDSDADPSDEPDSNADPDGSPGGLFGACICPREGPWTINNLPGQMACTGAANITMPLAPSTQSGNLEIRDGCNTIIGTGVSEDDATLVMQRQSDCGYQGTVGGSQDGIPMTIEFKWTVNSETQIVGDLGSTVSQQGMTCNMSRNYNMNAAN